MYEEVNRIFDNDSDRSDHMTRVHAYMEHAMQTQPALAELLATWEQLLPRDA